MIATTADPIECPGCEQPQDGETVYATRGGFRCRDCDLSFAARDLRPQWGLYYYLITMHWSTGAWRVERVEFTREVLDAQAERTNANRRHNARMARVIERGELGRSRAARPTTLLELLGIGEDGRDLPF